MLIFGAKGFAKEVLEVFYELNQFDNLVFYDDVSNDLPEMIFDRYPILNSFESAISYFKNQDSRFTIAIGNPMLRKLMYDKFSSIGGEYVSTISPNSKIGNFEVHIGKGSNVLSGSIFSNSTTLGMGCIVYYNSIITHDCVIGDFVEISPSVTLLGGCSVGSYSQIGSNSTILPKVKIGKNVIIGAGSVVTKDVPDNSLVIGIPAIIKKKLIPLIF